MRGTAGGTGAERIHSMCRIVGYVGPRPSVDIVVGGLKKLECLAKIVTVE
jgi:hypothetical protein